MWITWEKVWLFPYFIIIFFFFLIKSSTLTSSTPTSSKYDQCDRESKNPRKETDCCHECMMHLVLTCVYVNVLPNHSNREAARIQQWDTSVSHIWSNCNCWGDCRDIPLRADQWLDRLTLWETIKQKATDSLMLHERALRRAQGTIWRLWDWQDTWHIWEKNSFSQHQKTHYTEKHSYTSRTLLKFNSQYRIKSRSCTFWKTK